MSPTTSNKLTKIIKWSLTIIALCILIFVLTFSIFIFIIFKKNDLHLIHGEITNSFSDIEYDNGFFLIKAKSGLYMDSSKTLDSVNSQFHSDMKIGDSVYVICKMDVIEIAPGPIDIYYMFKFYTLGIYIQAGYSFLFCSQTII